MFGGCGEISGETGVSSNSVTGVSGTRTGSVARNNDDEDEDDVVNGFSRSGRPPRRLGFERTEVRLPACERDSACASPISLPPRSAMNKLTWVGRGVLRSGRI